MANLSVFVPTENSLLLVAPGSGIVGTRHFDLVTVDFEGNVHGASNIVTYEDKLLHAADRHVTKYPTVARRTVRSDDLHEVGNYDTDTHVLDVFDQAAIDRWQEGKGYEFDI